MQVPYLVVEGVGSVVDTQVVQEIAVYVVILDQGVIDWQEAPALE